MNIDFNNFDVDKCFNISILKKYFHYLEFAYGCTINTLLTFDNIFSDDCEYFVEFGKKYNFYLNKAKEYFDYENKK